MSLGIYIMFKTLAKIFFFFSSSNKKWRLKVKEEDLSKDLANVWSFIDSPGSHS